MLTERQRRLVYKRMLKYFENVDTSVCLCFGFCHALKWHGAPKSNKNPIYDTLTIYDFPELMEYKPTFHGSPFWFSVDNKDARVDILKRILKL